MYSQKAEIKKRKTTIIQLGVLKTTVSLFINNTIVTDANIRQNNHINVTLLTRFIAFMRFVLTIKKSSVKNLCKVNAFLENTKFY